MTKCNKQHVCNIMIELRFAYIYHKQMSKCVIIQIKYNMQ